MRPHTSFISAVTACEAVERKGHGRTAERGFAIFEGEAMELLRALPDACVDAVVTDPPYSSGGNFRGDRMQSTHKKYVGGAGRRRPDFDGDNRDQRSFIAWCSMWMGEAMRATKPGGVLCVFSDWRQLPAMTDAVQAGGWIWRGTVPWDKTEACRPRHGGFRAQSEFVAWASKGPLDPRRSAQVGYLPGAFRVRINHSERLHQTAKPLALMQQLVLVCPPGGTVLDPFAGSGTTVLASLAEGCRALGFERVREYAEIARRRCVAEDLPPSIRDTRKLGASPKGHSPRRVRHQEEDLHGEAGSHPEPDDQERDLYEDGARHPAGEAFGEEQVFDEDLS